MDAGRASLTQSGIAPYDNATKFFSVSLSPWLAELETRKSAPVRTPDRAGS